MTRCAYGSGEFNKQTSYCDCVSSHVVILFAVGDNTTFETAGIGEAIVNDTDSELPLIALENYKPNPKQLKLF